MDNQATSESVELSPFSEETNFTDVELLVEGQTLHTSKSLLALASPVFSCMFTSAFRERNEKVIALPVKECDAVRDMLSFLHPGVDFKITKDNVFALIPLAEEYQIPVLKSACEEFLLHSISDQMCLTSEYVVKCLETAEKCSLRSLMKKCMNTLAKPDFPLEELKENPEISLQTKAAIFEQRITRLEREKVDVEAWKCTVKGVKQRLRDIVTQHDDHCRCRVEIKLRNPVQRTCPYCSRTWCSDNINTEAYRNSYKFFCNHKIGYHINHDAAVRSFIDQTES